MVTNDLSPRRFFLGVESELAHHLENDLLVVSGLIEILLPLFLEVGIDGTLESRLIDLDAALLGLQRLIQQFGNLFVLQFVTFLSWIPDTEPRKRVPQGACRDSPIQSDGVAIAGKGACPRGMQR
jgi:hypothetical protein